MGLAPRIENIENGTTGPLSFRNKIINGNFDIWQRATSYSGVGGGSATNASGYASADRWFAQAYAGSAGSGTTNFSIAQQVFTAGQIAVPSEPVYFCRFNASAVGTQGGTGSMIRATQRIESVRTFAGQTCTLSFWAKADTTRTYAVILTQIFGTGGSSNVTAGQSTFSVTSAWQKFSITFTVPSISGKTVGTANDMLELNFVLYKQDNTIWGDTLGAIGTWSTTPYLDLSQVQIEKGSTATAFEQRSIGLETSLCQRYYQVIQSGQITGAAASPTVIFFTINLPTTMRIGPSAGGGGASFKAWQASSNSIFTGGSVDAVNTSTPTSFEFQCASFSPALTQGSFCIFRGPTTGQFGLSAEL